MIQSIQLASNLTNLIKNTSGTLNTAINTASSNLTGLINYTSGVLNRNKINNIYLTDNILYKTTNNTSTEIYSSVVRSINGIGSNSNCNISMSACNLSTTPFTYKYMTDTVSAGVSSVQEMLQNFHRRLNNLDNASVPQQLKNNPLLCIYIDPTNGNDLSGGLFPSSAIKSIQHAVQIINTYRFSNTVNIYLLFKSGSHDILFNCHDCNFISHPDCTATSNSEIHITSYEYTDGETSAKILNDQRYEKARLAQLNFKIDNWEDDDHNPDNGQHSIIYIRGVNFIIENIIFNVSSYNSILINPRIKVLQIDNGSRGYLLYNVQLNGISYVGISVSNQAQLTVGNGKANQDQRLIHTITFSKYEAKDYNHFQSIAIYGIIGAKLRLQGGTINITNINCFIKASMFSQYMPVTWQNYTGILIRKRINYIFTKESCASGNNYLYQVDTFSQILNSYAAYKYAENNTYNYFDKSNIETKISSNKYTYLYDIKAYNGGLCSDDTSQNITASSEILDEKSFFITCISYTTTEHNIKYANIEKDNTLTDPNYYGCVIV